MSGPLQGIKILELSQIMAGPSCGLLLADLGAEVIKIEKIQGGDDTRRFLPPDINGESAAFMIMNRNKRGIALDLKSKQGVNVFKKMVKKSDVVIENFRKGTLEKLGIGYKVLKKINPRIILCEISGYGRSVELTERAKLALRDHYLSTETSNEFRKARTKEKFDLNQARSVKASNSKFKKVAS